MISRPWLSIISQLPVPQRMALLERHLRQYIEQRNGNVSIQYVNDLSLPLACRCERHMGEMRILLSQTERDKARTFRMTWMRLPTMVYLASRLDPNIRSIAGDLSDGGDQEAGWLSYCSRRDDAILVPDPVFFNSRGYAQYRPLVGLHWDKRSDIVLWRGSATGLGRLTSPTMSGDDSALRARVRLCLKLASVPRTDVKLRKLVNVEPDDRVELLSSAGILGGKIRQSDWRRFKFAIDIDGFTNSWPNLFVRLLLGCCVLKVESEQGYRQWYYDRLEPWVNYVPVRADMADIEEKIAWCRSHDAECRRIAEAGKSLAQSMTVETEMRQAVERINQRMCGGSTIRG